jgi:regulator of protease activity HflC (stomatin/prohibitin superfamily)
MFMRSLIFTTTALAALTFGCTGALVEPGHRGLLFDPNDGLKHEVLGPGYHRLSTLCVAHCPRVDDFDVTYSTRKEGIRTTSIEGLQMDLRLALIYRPIISELYELETEVGPSDRYYDEVVGPEFRSAARGVLARHSYAELIGKDEKIEDEIEAEVRRRIHGKHVEIASITLESVDYAPEIAAANRARIVGEQEAARKKAAIANEHQFKTTQVENRSEEERMEAEAQAAHARQQAQAAAEQAKLAAEAEDVAKQHELSMAKLDTTLAKAKMEARIADARSEAESMKLLAHAHAEEHRAEAQAITPLTVQMHAYDALGKLGGEGTTVLLGDWSRVPNFLFPRSGAFLNAYGLPPAQVTSAPQASASQPHANVPASVTAPKGSGLGL